MTRYDYIDTRICCQIITDRKELSTKLVGTVIRLAVATKSTFHSNALGVSRFPARISLNDLGMDHTFERRCRIRYD